MAIQVINIGTSANKGDGEPLRTAFDKINDNFAELSLKVTNLETGGVTVTTGDIKGSVFGDDSTVLVDGVNSIIPSANLSGALPALDGSALTNVSVSSIDFANITNTPTTIAGYGITDALTSTLASALDVNSKDLQNVFNVISGDGVVTNFLYKNGGTETNHFTITATGTDFPSGTTVDFTGATVTGLSIPAGYTDSDVDTHLNTNTAGAGEVLSWTGADYDWVAQSSGGITDVVSDTTPQLGGNLDLNSNNITGTGNINITGTLALGGNSISGVDNISAGTLNNHTIPGGSAGTLALTSDLFDGNYNSLSNQPTIPSTLTDLSISDGSTGDLLTTNGAGSFSFTNNISVNLFDANKVVVNSGGGSEPTGTGDSGTTGEIRYTDNYIYIKTASSGWKRVLLESIA